MNKYLILLLGLICFTACTNEVDEVFDKTASERVEIKKQELLAALQSSPNGWFCSVNPNNENVGIFNFLVKFESDKKAFLTSDIDIMAFESSMDSAYYKVSLDQSVSLKFTTYSQWSFFKDPSYNSGKDLGGDFELLYQSFDGNKIEFIGKTNKAKYIFHKNEVIKEDYVTFMNTVRGTELNLAFMLLDDETLFPTVLLKDGTKLWFEYLWTNRVLNLHYNTEDGNVKVHTTKVNFDPTSLILNTPITINNQTITKFDFDEENYAFVIGDENVEGGIVLEELPPISQKGVAERFAKIEYGPVTGWSKNAKSMRKALEASTDDRFTTLQFYNTDKIFHGVSFKFSDPSEWPYIKFKNNAIKIIGEDRIVLEPDGFFNEVDNTVDINEILASPEGKALYDILFDPEGFIVYKEIAYKIFSVKDPSVWFLVSDYGL